MTRGLVSGAYFGIKEAGATAMLLASAQWNTKPCKDFVWNEKPSGKAP